MHNKLYLSCSSSSVPLLAPSTLQAWTPGADIKKFCSAYKRTLSEGQLIPTECQNSIHIGPKLTFLTPIFEQVILPLGRVLSNTITSSIFIICLVFTMYPKLKYFIWSW